MGDFWQPTAEMFSSLFEKPKMAEKLLIKPPFKYFFDILTETTKVTKFAQGLYNEEELNPNTYQQKETKLLYLKKIVDLVQLMTKKEVAMKPNKMIAGIEPENTNIFLQDIYKLATGTVDSAPYVKKILSNFAKMEAMNLEQQKPQEKQAEPEQEKKPSKPPQQEKDKEKEKEAVRLKEEKEKKEKELQEREARAKEKKERETKAREESEKAAKEREKADKTAKEKSAQEKAAQEKASQEKAAERERTKEKEEPPKNIKKETSIERPPSASRKAPVVKEKSSVETKETKVVKKDVPSNVILEKKGSKNDDDDLIMKEEPGNPKMKLDNIKPGSHGQFINEALNEQDRILKENEKPVQAKEETGGIKFKKIGAAKDKKEDPSKTYMEPKSVGNAFKFDIEGVKKLIQSLCQNTNPLGKSLEFLHDDIESMNKENDYWRKQFMLSKQKHQAELRKTEDQLQPVQDKLAEIEEKIKDQNIKIQNLRAQIIKNSTTIHSLLYSVVSSK